MSISTIQNKILRRVIFIISVIPIVIFSMVYQMGLAAIEVLKEVPGACKETWGS